MSAFNISAVSGTAPNWDLVVNSSFNVHVDDQVIGTIDGSVTSGVYRVASVPDSTHMSIVDDLDTTPYGKPAVGQAGSCTPTTRFGLSQLQDGTHKWGAPWRRDNRIIDEHLEAGGGGDPRDHVLALNNPTGELTAEHIAANNRVLVYSSAAPIPATTAKTSTAAAEPYDLGGGSTVATAACSNPETYNLYTHVFWYFNFEVTVDGGAHWTPHTGTVKANEAPIGVLAADVAGLLLPVIVTYGLTSSVFSSGGINYVQVSHQSAGSQYGFRIVLGTDPADLGVLLNFDGNNHLGADTSLISYTLRSLLDDGAVIKNIAVNNTDFLSPTNVSAADMVNALNIRIGTEPLHFDRVVAVPGAVPLYGVRANHTLTGSSHSVQIFGDPIEGSINLNTILGIDTDVHHGTDEVAISIALPAPTDPVAAKGWPMTIVNDSNSLEIVQVPHSLTLDPGNGKQFMWDGTGWSSI